MIVLQLMDLLNLTVIMACTITNLYSDCTVNNVVYFKHALFSINVDVPFLISKLFLL